MDDEVKFNEVTLNKSGKIIVRYNNDDFTNKLKNALGKIEDANIYKLKANRSIIIKAVPKYVDEDRIIDDLRKKYDVNGTIKTKMLSNTRFKFNRFIITLNEEKAHELVNHEKIRICFKTCEVQPYTNPIQCLWCGQFGHIAFRNGQKVCNNDPCCLKCNDSHPIMEHNKQATNEKNKTTTINEVKCKNCKSDQYNSDSKECRIFKKIIENLIKRW